MTERIIMIDGHTKIFGILGRPVAHSLSPVMHNAAFRHLGMNAVYVAFPVTELAPGRGGPTGVGDRRGERHHPLQRGNHPPD